MRTITAYPDFQHSATADSSAPTRCFVSGGVIFASHISHLTTAEPAPKESTPSVQALLRMYPSIHSNKIINK